MLLDEVLLLVSESDSVDFKSAFDPEAPGDWLELVKDIVAIANHGGGWILIGVLDNGHPAGFPVELQKKLDPAVLADKVRRYTDVNLSGLTCSRCLKGDQSVAAISIPGCEYPIPFSKPGTYQIDTTRQKTAFAQGSLYFRHSAKSEVASFDDLRHFVDRKIQAVKDFWLKGITQVVEAPKDSFVAVLPAEVRLSDSPDATPVRLTHELAAKILSTPMVDHTHPFRQKEIIDQFNQRTPNGQKINQHDILCVRRAYNVQRNPKFCYNLNWSSPRYSKEFLDWLLQAALEDAQFFEKARIKADQSRKKA